MLSDLSPAQPQCHRTSRVTALKSLNSQITVTSLLTCASSDWLRTPFDYDVQAVKELLMFLENTHCSSTMQHPNHLTFECRLGMCQGTELERVLLTIPLSEEFLL